MRKSYYILFILLLIQCGVWGQDSTWTLQKCIQYGYENNIALRQRQLANEQNIVTRAQARSNRLPLINGNASQNFSAGRSIDPFSNQFVTKNILSNNFSLNGSITLFNGFQTQNQIRQSEINYEAGSMDVEAVKTDLTLSIAQAYYQILLAGELVENSRTQVRSTEAQVERTRRLVELGKVAELNLLQLQSQLASDKLTLTNSENQLYLSKVNLMQLLDLPITENFSIQIPPETTELSTVAVRAEDIYQKALGTQPLVRSLELKKQSTYIGLKIAQGTRLPRLTLNGNIFTGYSSARSLTSIQSEVVKRNIGFLDSDPSQLVTGLVPVTSTTRSNYPFSRQLRDNIGQTISFNLFIPILNNRVSRTSIERARLSMQIAELDEKNGKNVLRKNIEQAYADMKSAGNMYQASKESVQMLEQSYLNAERRFGLGMISPADLIIEKNNYIRAKTDFAQARYQYILKAKILEFYASNQL